MKTTHRYVILSNHMANLTQFEHRTNWDLYVAQRDSHFNVLKQHTYSGKTAIFFLHLPNDESWKLFKNTVVTIDEKLIEDCIIRFKNKCNEAIIPELATEEWLNRCAFPVGVSNNGELFEIE